MAEVTINSFRGDHRWLSNFWYTPSAYDGVTYRTSEHAYQAAKTVITEEREAIRACEKPGSAKKLGQEVTMRPRWNNVKLKAMREILESKFSKPLMASQLAATGDAELIEGNHWCDTYWGVCYCSKHNGAGQNNLGNLLMGIRRSIQAKQRAIELIEFITRQEGPLAQSIQLKAVNSYVRREREACRRETVDLIAGMLSKSSAVTIGGKGGGLELMEKWKDSNG
jgi:ribA/ribD-fused uncharacterized protein